MDKCTPDTPSILRKVFGLIVLAALIVIIGFQVRFFLTHPDAKRPHDFLQVWSAGRLVLEGDNPYDGKKMLNLQLANQSPRRFASMMWVPPWGLAIAMPIGALPVSLAEGVWLFGQFGLILVCAWILWRLNGGLPERWWAPVLLVFTFGPVWWQIGIGQYAGLLLFGMVGYLAAHKANRPLLGGLCLTLVALKPHLLVLFAVGLLIDSVRTASGRRVVLGGILGLSVGALVATAASPSVWSDYSSAVSRGGTDYAPSLYNWFSPTVSAWIRFLVPGHGLWIQVLPATIAAVAFAAYWWRSGDPKSWPRELNWVVPACLLLAPYGGWPSDLVLFLIPIVAMTARVDARGWAVPGLAGLAAVYLAANAGVMVMYMTYGGTEHYVWVAPVLCSCLLWLRLGLSPKISLSTGPLSVRLEQSALQPHSA